MSDGEVMVRTWRGDFLETEHRGHAVIVDRGGEVVSAWGDPELVFLPRSCAKMLQALPLVTSGAADAAGLGSQQIALASASHLGQPVHTDLVGRWLAAIELGDDALSCGPEMPRRDEDRDRLIRAGEAPCRIHNNCSGKHAGFLTLARHLGAKGDYCAADHPVQRAVVEAVGEAAGIEVPGYGIDGCSAPNYAMTLSGHARAMARFAADRDGPMARIRDAMRAHPELVCGAGAADTRLMEASGGRAVVKFGADGAHIAIVPDLGIGLALKIADGSQVASDSAVAALLVRLGVVDAADPAVAAILAPVIRSRAGQDVGRAEADETVTTY